jgi:IS4 transposase
LCLSLFPWARFRKTKAAIKLHTLLNLRGSIPEFIHISDGKLHDVNILDILIVQPGSFYLMDRGYVDFARLYTIQQASAFFVTRCKRNFQFKRRYSHPVDKTTGLRCDQTIVTTGVNTAKDYPTPLRRIRYYDVDTGNNLIFITNNFDLSALTITQLYKARWQVELFFKWIKQHLRIKAFYGTSANAVKTQVWIAVSVYVLVAILKKQLSLDQSLYTILQFLSVSIFEKTPISDAFSQEFNKTKIVDHNNQLLLFDL